LRDFGDFFNVLNIWISWRHSTLHSWCVQAAWHGPDTHLAGPALLRVSGHGIPQVVLARNTAAQAYQPEVKRMLHLKFSNFHIPASWQKLRISSAKIWLKAACI